MPISPISIGTVDPGPDAKFGKTENPNAAAVFGVNNGNRAEGFLAGKNPLGSTPVGSYGESESLGVFGFAKTAQAIGVAGNSANGAGIGVQGHTTSTNIGVLGSSDGTAALPANSSATSRSPATLTAMKQVKSPALMLA